MNFLSFLLLSSAILQSNPHAVKIQDPASNPVEGVYVAGNRIKFLYSNREGVIQLPSFEYLSTDSIHVSHLSYQPCTVSILDVLANNNTITLQSDVKELKEVIVSAIDIKKYVYDVMAGLVDKYGDPMASDGINLAGQLSLVRGNDDYQLIDYKGELLLSTNKKGKMFAAKLPQYEVVAEDLKKNLFDLKPHHILSKVSPMSHPVVRKYKYMEYYDHEYVTYRGCDALKVYFRIERKIGGQEGYIVINTADDAIMSVMYDVRPCSPFIIGLSFKGLTKTSMLGYYVESDYVKDELGKYNFDSGRQKLSISTSEKGKVVQVTYDIKLKRTAISNAILQQPKVPIEELFK